MLKYAQAKGGWNTIHIHMLMQDICLQGGGPYYLTLFSASQVLTQAADQQENECAGACVSF